MAIKNLLVAYGGSDSSDAALDFALFIQRKYDSHLTGLLAHHFAPINQIVGSWIPEDVRESIQKAQKIAVKDIESRFRQRVVSSPTPDKNHWISQSGEGDATVGQYARFYDLVVLGRHDAVHGEDQQELHPDKIAMVSGRPVLLVPRDFNTSTFNEHAVLAWDGKRASSRALADAMQILKTKRLVTVITVDESESEKSLPEINVKTTLERHGVNAEIVQLRSKGKTIADTIIEFVEEAEPKLLVMGAYEHSKFRQSIVGGVTNSVLKRAKIPVFLSH